MRKYQLELNEKAAKDAIEEAFNHYQPDGKNIMVVVNFREPSYRKRLYVVDLNTKEIIRAHHVAHGSRSNCVGNPTYACNFSNVVGSRKSSVGAMRTGKTYTWGKRFPTRTKLKLHGLEKGINNNVFARAIVVHSSNYVTDAYIMRHGRAGNSWGCLAVDPAIADSLIDLIKDGIFVYIYH